MKLHLLVLAGLVAFTPFSDAQDKYAESRALVRSLMQSGDELKEIPFSEVVLAATGRKILPLDGAREADRELLAKLGKAMDEVLQRMNATNSPAQQQRRINEVSGHFENEIKRVLDALPGFACEVPLNAQGRAQRTGYPDLRVVEKQTGRVIYLDPKLYERGSRQSSFRTFYFEPKIETNKILDDAHHLLIGIEHDGRQDGYWKFLNWDIVDISRFQVRLKAEFQGSNRDLYRPELIVGSSRN
jgi:hypothetical protein